MSRSEVERGLEPFDRRNEMMGMSGIMVAMMAIWMMLFGGFFGHMGIG